MSFFKNNTNGFTLIELIIVIVILGIISATVAPKFFDFERDAKIANIQRIYSSYESTIEMLRAQAVFQNKLEADAVVKTKYGDYHFHRGYPETLSEATSPELYFIDTFLEIGLAENEVIIGQERTATYDVFHAYEDNFVSRLGYGSGNLQSDQCYVEYFHQQDTPGEVEESLTIFTDGC